MGPEAGGYHCPMMYKLTFGAGFAAGYYFGAKAGRQRYDEINRMLGKLRQSPKVEAVTDKARTVLDEGVDRAKSLVGDQVDKAKSAVTRKSNAAFSTADGSHHGTNTIPGVQATQAGPGVQATQAGPGVQATQAGPGVQATQAGPGVQATQAGPPAAPLTTGTPGTAHSSSR